MAILLFTIKVVEIFELHASMPGVRSDEYQMTIPLKFLIIIHNHANVWTINHPIKITTRVLGSEVAGRHLRPVDSDVAERRKRLEVLV